MSLFHDLLENPDPTLIRAVLTTTDPAVERSLFIRAQEVTRARFGATLQFFAPLYVSNQCVNNCLYCAFRRENRAMPRQTLTQEEARTEAHAIVAFGHDAVLVVASEHPRHAGAAAIADRIRVIRTVPGIRHVDAEIMPLAEADYRRLRDAGVHAVLVYQETYDRARYGLAHPDGPKSSFGWRLDAPARALRGGIPRVGLGILVGLGDPADDVAQLIEHARTLHDTFGLWPATVSLPRIQPAAGAPWAVRPPEPVDDRAFVRLIAMIRLALPNVGIMLSTRESPALRDRLLALRVGVTHLSAGSRTGVGGYTRSTAPGQFSIQDDRPLQDVMAAVQRLGYHPSCADSPQSCGATSRGAA